MKFSIHIFFYQVWELLLLLPTNPKVLKQLHSLSEDKAQWTLILDHNSPFQLLYSLQILESIVLEESKDQVIILW